MATASPFRPPELPPQTEEERKRSALICRLAGVLEDMRARGLGAAELGEDPIAWKDRPDFEQLLDAWELGEHPAQRPAPG
jgi:hypothetical protein